MVKVFLVFLIFWQNTSYAQEEAPQLESALPEITAKLKALKIETDPNFEEQFNKLVRQLEQTLEKEKSICIGELSTDAGGIISKENRPVCLRTVKGNYLKSLDEVHQLRKKYLSIVHQKQLKELDENYNKIKEQFDKNF